MDPSFILGHGLGWLGVLFGLCVAPPQLYRIIKHKRTKNISRMTYGFLLATMACYLLHAIYIVDWPFIVSNGINLSINGVIFALLVIDQKKYKELKSKMLIDSDSVDSNGTCDNVVSSTPKWVKPAIRKGIIGNDDLKGIVSMERDENGIWRKV